MSLLSFLARSSRGLLTSAVLTSVLSGLGASLLVGLINESLQATSAQLVRLGLEFAALGLGMSLFRWLSQSQFVTLSETTLARLRLHVSRHFAAAPYPELEARGSARLLSVLTEDVHTVSDFFVTLPRFVMHGAVVLGCLGYLAWLSLPVFGFALGVVLVGVLGHLWSAARARPHLRRGREAEDGVYAHFRALFSGAKELRLNSRRREAFLSRVLGPGIERVRREQSAGYEIHAAAGSARIFLFYVVIGVVLFGLASALGLEGRVRSGYALMFLYMMLPLHALVEASPEISRTRIALERLYALGVMGGSASASLPESAPAAASGPRPQGSGGAGPLALRQLELRQLQYRHRREGEEAVFALGPLDLRLEPGEIVFLVGGNGSGKTTLAKLLVGLYEPDAGELWLNGVRIGSAEREAYRQNFSSVFSDFHLFQSLLGLPPERLDERAAEFLDALDLAHKVQVRHGVFTTTELSRGQQKRLALVVALLEDRPLYVFDEWAADQDPAYKAVFYQRLLPELRARGKAVFVITHDDRYFTLADRCLELNAGQLCPIGPAGPVSPALAPGSVDGLRDAAAAVSPAISPAISPEIVDNSYHS